MKNLTCVAESNLAALKTNPYPGRVIITGLDETGENLVQVYAIMGRSENSRNRVFGSEGGRLFTEAADPSKVKDPSLIIYNAMREGRNNDITLAVVSNGSQTDEVAEGSTKGRSLNPSLNLYTYEPDKPNFTPRITAVSFWYKGKANVEMSILRKSPWSSACDRHLYEINDIGQGFGYCFHTYSGDDDPLPSFQGEPYLLPLYGNIKQVTDTFWNVLDVDNRVSLAVKFIPKRGDSYTVIFNKYCKVG